MFTAKGCSGLGYAWIGVAHADIDLNDSSQSHCWFLHSIGHTSLEDSSSAYNLPFKSGSVVRVFVNVSEDWLAFEVDGKRGKTLSGLSLANQPLFFALGGIGIDGCSWTVQS